MSPMNHSHHNRPNHRNWRSKNKLAKRLVNEVLKSSPIPITCTIGIESNATNELLSNFYNYATTSSSSTTSSKETSSTENCMVHHHGLLMVIDMAPPPIFSNSNLLRRRRHKQLIQVTTVTDKPRKNIPRDTIRFQKDANSDDTAKDCHQYLSGQRSRIDNSSSTYVLSKPCIFYY